MDSKIPAMLRNTDFRFTRIPAQEKRPIDKNWQDRNNFQYDDRELQDHIKDGGNYGVVSGFGNLVVIDADEQEVADAVTDNLPSTFVVRTGSGGFHFYYLCEGLEDPIRLVSDNPGDVGDVQAQGKQVVGPGSVHPSGNSYKVVKDRSIAEVRAEDIKFALRDWLKSKKDVMSGANSTQNGQETNLSLKEMVDLGKLTQSGDGEYYGAHPLHGSGTGRNFWINVDKNVWHCFRHGSGGGPFLWLAVREGIIDCSEAEPGALQGEQFKEVVQAAVDNDLITEGAAEELAGEGGEKTMRKPSLVMDGVLAEQVHKGSINRYAVWDGEEVI